MTEPPEDSTVSLPGPHDPDQETGGVLPAAERRSTTLPGPSTMAPAAPVQFNAHPAVPEASTPHGPGDSPTQRARLEDQIRAATHAGGLTQLPPDFGDPGGGWTSIESSDPFENLFLDHRQADRISGEILARHYQLISAFWTEKLKLMRQGSARTMILAKYGREHESEKLVANYPRRLSEAFDKLKTIEGFKAVVAALEAERSSAILNRLDAKLSDFLIDRSLRPPEARALFDFAASEQLPREVVAEHIHRALVARGLHPLGEPVGATLEARIVSVSWGDAAPPVLGHEVPKRPGRAVRAALLAGLSGAIVVTVIALTLAFREKRGVDPSADPGGALSQPATKRDVTPRNAAEDGKADTTALPGPVADATETRNEIEARNQRNAADALRRKSIASCKASLRNLGDTTAALIAGASFVEARARIEKTSVECAPVSAELPSDYATLTSLRREVDDAEVQSRLRALEAEQEAKAWQSKLEGIDADLVSNRLIEAKNAADRLLADPATPPQVAEIASARRAEAEKRIQEALQAFAPTVKSKTVRPGKPPGG